MEQKDIGVSSPSDKLENLFLRIVREAQAAAVQTSGAHAGKVAAFLGGSGREKEGALIESLVAAGRTQPEAQAPAPEPEPVEPAKKEVLDALIDKPSEAPQPAGADASEEQAPQKTEQHSQVDRNVIDSLLSREEQTGE
jgi:hypothetical protein